MGVSLELDRHRHQATKSRHSVFPRGFRQILAVTLCEISLSVGIRGCSSSQMQSFRERSTLGHAASQVSTDEGPKHWHSSQFRCPRSGNLLAQPFVPTRQSSIGNSINGTRRCSDFWPERCRSTRTRFPVFPNPSCVNHRSGNH